MKKLKENIKKKNFEKLYLFYGEESYLLELYEKRLKEAALTPEEAMMNMEVFSDAKTLSTDAISAAVMTPPFLAERRLVIVKESGLFNQGKKAESDALAGVLGKLPEESILLFVEKSIDKRTKSYKAAAKAGAVIEFSHPKEADLIKWVIIELRGKGLAVDKDTAAYFLRHTGGSMQNAVSEFSKLAAYKGGEGHVSKEDIDALCTKALLANIFDLVGAMGRHMPRRALEIYKDMLLAKEAPMRIMAMVIRQIRLIYQTKLLLEAGYTAKDISARLRVHDFVIKECASQSENFSVKTLRKALEDCLETDEMIKNGLIKDELGVELLIVKYSA
ncbi:MAG: DNA polymerase III subunit delta [Firmicutes bacterium]|nr:DNA polymerase III subunit delta [Bacillota bacterium]